MKKTELLILLEKYRLGTINSAELSLLESWYLQWKPSDLGIDHEELETIKSQVWDDIQQEVVQHKPFRLWRPMIAAAIILMLVIPFSYLSYQSWRKTNAVDLAVQPASLQDFKPGTDRATLTLANGKKILLNDAGNGHLALQGSASVSKTADGRLVYEHSHSNNINSQTSIYNNMSTPRGGTYQLSLSDGTKVWLNSSSSITFPVVFQPGERKVMLTGEAYFEVAHLANRPFRVVTGGQELTVLGTHFNIKAYADDAAISTTLLEGSIRLKNLKSGKSDLLKPGQEAGLYPDQDQFQFKSVNAQDAISWKKGYFIFDNQPVESIVKTLGRWYDADFEFQGITQEKIGGTFSRSANLADILTNLEQIGQIRFKGKGKKIIVTATGKEEYNIKKK